MISGGMPTIFVSDMDGAVSFYTEILGLRLAFRAADHWASIDAGDGLTIGLHPASVDSPPPGTSGAISVGLSVTQPIADVVKMLEDRGVRFSGPVIDEGMLRLAFFTDPDGNDLYLSEQPRWEGEQTS